MVIGVIFDRKVLEQALDELGRRAHAEGKTVEIAIYGGSALMLTYDWRRATKDVGAVFEADRQTGRPSGVWQERLRKRKAGTRHG